MNRTVILSGIGTARPVGSIEQDDAAMLAQTLCASAQHPARALSILYGRSGVQRRGSVLLESAGAEPSQSFFPPAGGPDDHGPTTAQRMVRYAQEAAPLAEAAARDALKDARLFPEAITQLITVSCTGFSAPGVDAALITRLGLPSTVGRTHIGFMGCHAALNGLRVGAALAAMDPQAHVLVCAVELCSLHFAYGAAPEQWVANALFADGAGAFVVAPTPHLDAAWRVAAHGSCLFPESHDAMAWRIGDHGFEMALSPRIPGLIRTHLRPWLIEWLAGQGLSLPQVCSWAIHPGGPRVLDAVAQALALSSASTAVSAEILATCGNMSSATMVFLLERLRQQDAPRPCVALGFGPGLIAEVALLR